MRSRPLTKIVKYSIFLLDTGDRKSSLKKETFKVIKNRFLKESNTENFHQHSKREL
jgi:hypothetical protein